MKLAHIHTLQKTSQQGTASVEAAIVLPAMLLLFLIIMDFGRVMHESINTTNAARSAAGYAAQSTTLSADISGINNAAIIDASGMKTDKYNASPVVVSSRRFCRCSGSSSEVSCQNNSCAAVTEVYAQVTATRDFHTLVPYPLIPSTIKLTRSATIRAQ